MTNRCPRCFTELNITGGYTDDPIKTPHGEAGDDYKGFTDIKPIHIQELQTLRAQQEIDAGIAEEDRTAFTEIDTESNLIDVYRKHILELRESTEKILTAIGQTKDTYFNYDEEGTEYNVGNHQTDWTDPNLAERINKFVNIKAYHIEDLRHFLVVTLWFDDFTGLSPVTSASGSVSASGGWDYDAKILLAYQGTPYASDNKNNQINVTSIINARTYGNPGSFASASGSIEFDKPIQFAISGSASATVEWSYAQYNWDTNILQLFYYPLYFQNPAPHPNIKITPNKKFYLTLSDFAWSGSGTINPTDLAGVANPSFIDIKIQIILYDENNNVSYYDADEDKTITFIIDYTFQPNISTKIPHHSETVTKYYVPLNDGINKTDIYSDFMSFCQIASPTLYNLILSETKSLYFCYYFVFSTTCRGHASYYIDGSPQSCSGSLEFTLHDIGYGIT